MKCNDSFSRHYDKRMERQFPIKVNQGRKIVHISIDYEILLPNSEYYDKASPFNKVKDYI